MPRLIIVGGASGAGKSFLLQRVEKWDASIEHVKKLTTRGPRSDEPEEVRYWLDLDFNRTEEEIRKCEYRYEYDKEWYGLKKGQIDSILAKGQNPIIIIRHCETIRKIKRDYNNAFVFYLQSGYSGRDLEAVLRKQGRNDIEIQKRKKRLWEDFIDFVAHRDLFDDVIINYYDEKTLDDQAQRILTEKLPEGFVQPDLVFVLMPFKDEFYTTYQAIKAAGRLVNGRPLTIDRMDEKRGPYKISDQILGRIKQSALIVADVTEYNPNVFFEMGYAHGIGKPVLPCAKKDKKDVKLPFDIKDFNTVLYKDPIDLQTKLTGHFMTFFPYFASQLRKE